MPDKKTKKKQSDPKINPAQDLYDIFVAQGINLVSKVGPKLVGAASPDLLGSTLFDIVSRIESEGEKNGVKFDLPTLFNGSKEILEHLIDVSQVDINEEQIKAVIGVAVGKYLNNAVRTGKMSRQDVAQLAQVAESQISAQGAGVGPEGPPGPATPGIAVPQGGGVTNV